MITPYQPQFQSVFTQLFADYYAELGCDDNAQLLVEDYVLPDWEADLLRLALAFDGEQCVGFIAYQVDGIENDWCFLEGYGDLREVYVAPTHRQRGLGKQLVAFAESDLGAIPFYTLPEEASEAFFIACGYTDQGGYCCDLDSKVFEKNT